MIHRNNMTWDVLAPSRRRRLLQLLGGAAVAAASWPWGMGKRRRPQEAVPRELSCGRRVHRPQVRPETSLVAADAATSTRPLRSS